MPLVYSIKDLMLNLIDGIRKWKKIIQRERFIFPPQCHLNGQGKVSICVQRPHEPGKPVFGHHSIHNTFDLGKQAKHQGHNNSDLHPTLSKTALISAPDESPGSGIISRCRFSLVTTPVPSWWPCSVSFSDWCTNGSCSNWCCSKR